MATTAGIKLRNKKFQNNINNTNKKTKEEEKMSNSKKAMIGFFIFVVMGSAVFGILGNLIK